MLKGIGKKLGLLIVGGTVFGLIAAVTILFAFKYWFSVNTDYDVVNEFINDEQQKLGMTCSDFKIVTMKYIEEKLSPIVLAGRKGKDWLALIDDGQFAEIKDYEEKVFRCVLVHAALDKKGKILGGDFQKMHELFGALRTYATSYGGEPRTSSSLKPTAFQKVDNLFSKIKSNNIVNDNLTIEN